jgi:hypothetical protein
MTSCLIPLRAAGGASSDIPVVAIVEFMYGLSVAKTLLRKFDQILCAAIGYTRLARKNFEKIGDTISSLSPSIVHSCQISRSAKSAPKPL